MPSRFQKYLAVSALFAVTAAEHAFRTRRHFYPAVVYLATSKLSMVIIGNFLLALILAFAHIVKATFFGRLREVEVERLVERGKDAIMETCLALTIFREEFNARTLALFACLGCAKAFHWLAQDRTEHLQTAPAASRLAHLRMTVFMALLTSIDAFVLAFGAQQIISRGPSVLILIVFEFLVLLVSNLTAASKYGLTLVSAASEGRMDPIGPYMFYVELVSDLINFILYATFFVLVCMHYGLPLHLVRDLYASYRTFRSRIEDFIRYRRATSQLNERFPEPTEEELSNSDRTCIICREEMSSAPASNNARPKTLPCGHMFHLSCLRSWFERQQSCPTCRTSLLPPRQGEQRGDQHQAGGEERHEPAAQEVFRNDHHAADNRQFRRRVVIQRQGQAQGQEQVPGAQQVRYLLSNKRLRIDRQRPFATNGFFALNARDPRDQVAPENRRRVHFVPLVVPANNAREAPGAAAGSGASSRSKHEIASAAASAAAAATRKALQGNGVNGKRSEQGVQSRSAEGPGEASAGASHATKDELEAKVQHMERKMEVMREEIEWLKQKVVDETSEEGQGTMD